MKKRYIFLLAIAVLWLGVSVFFYFQNRVTVKTIFIPGWEIDQSGPLVQIKEVRLVNKEMKSFLFDERDIRNRIMTVEWMPYQMKTVLLRAASFYNFSYSDTDAWHLELSGIYLHPDLMVDGERPDIKIRVNGTDISINGWGNMGNEESNFGFFSVRSRRVDPEIQTLEVEWRWKGDEGSRVIKENFKTTSYVFNKGWREYDAFDPNRAALSAFMNFFKKKGLEEIKTEVDDNVLASKLQELTDYRDTILANPNAVYIGRYKGFEHVFAVKMNYIFKPTDLANQKFDGEQIFYMQEEKSVWKIIDISDLTRI